MDEPHFDKATLWTAVQSEGWRQCCPACSLCLALLLPEQPHGLRYITSSSSRRFCDEACGVFPKSPVPIYATIPSR